MKYLFITILVSACGGTYHVTSDPVQVNHTFSLNFQDIMQSCQNYCNINFPSDPTCPENCFNNTVNEIMNSLGVHQ